MHRFLPVSRDCLAKRGWREIDILLVTGDAYFDHPSHGAALIGRVLEARGYRVALIAQPDWRSADALGALGRPRLFVGVTGGAVDSLVNNYTADLRRRRSDAYSPGGASGRRPDFASLVYANRARQAFPGVPVVLGGVEASLRRFAYFDPVKNRVRRSVLVDSRADLLVYGAGELQAIEIAERLSAGRSLEEIAGTARLVPGTTPVPDSALELPPYGEICDDIGALVTQAIRAETAAGPGFRRRVFQRYEEGIVLAEPPPDAGKSGLDRLLDLPFARDAHPAYREPVPALATVRWSLSSHRGCPGGCSFCGVAAHQGRRVIPRSGESVVEEVRRIASHPDFRGTITDVGGPTANAYGAVSKKPEACTACRRASCLFPAICRHLDTDHRPLMRLLEDAAAVPGVSHLLVASGIRHDLALKDPDFIVQLAARHTGGHLKVAPEHVVPAVLRQMRKPPIGLFEEFEARFLEASRRAKKEQYLVPYFIAAFPGCTARDAREVSRWLQRRGQRLRQSQSYTPLPGTLAAAMQAARIDPDGRPIFVADPAERQRQKQLLLGKGGRSGTVRR